MRCGVLSLPCLGLPGWILFDISLFVHSLSFPGLSGRRKNFWKLAILVVFWLLWKERNRRIFEDSIVHFLCFFFNGPMCCSDLSFDEFLDTFFLGN